MAGAFMTQPLCVASVPADPPYVRRVLASPDVDVLPDPVPEGAPAGRWWPPVELDATWIRQNRDRADLLHIHFGTESFSPEHLARVLDAATESGWPVVQTVHDLEHPQLTDQEPYRRQLDLLVPRVDALITLTPGAARVIEERWRREAIVLPHPRLLADGIEPPRGFHHDVPVIGVHLKDLRPNVDGPGAVAALAAALTRLADRGVRATGEVRMHRRTRDDAARDAVRELCAGRPDIVLVETDRLDDAQLANALSHLGACILPYRTGTHSGWLELCWDLGVPVAAPEVGFFAEQHPDPTVASFAWDDDGHSLATALTRLLHAAPPAGSEQRRHLATTRLAARAVTDKATADAHASLYRRLVAEKDAA
jgi:hypothetical protein